MPHRSVARILAPSQRLASVSLVVDREHYEKVILEALSQAQVSVWIATANLKEVMIEAPLGSVARARRRYISITERFFELTNRGVEIRILHATAPSRPLRKALSKRRSLKPPRFELRQCARVHFKMVAVDGRYLYLGSANFTGAGLGAKGDARRNFELGLATEDDVLLDVAQARFDQIWSGAECASCRLQVRHMSGKRPSQSIQPPEPVQIAGFRTSCGGGGAMRVSCLRRLRPPTARRTRRS